jgi:UDP-N-acetylmuramyl pentapeptide phosphotransferase/UDP-N-acetylglucosamine-1-phosphate transferase
MLYDSGGGNTHRNDTSTMMAGYEMWRAALTCVLVLAAAFAVSAGLCAILRPLLLRYAMAKPNQRSSHRVPTPQGGGIAVIAATLLTVAGAFFIVPDLAQAARVLGMLTLAALGLAVVGISDDIRPLGAMPRLALQAAGVALVIAILPDSLRVLSFMPWWLERALMLLAGVWFVNLVNFMDGIDWMTVGEVVAMTIGLALAAALGALPPEAGVVTIALCGGILGFAPLNRPVARLFLGDVGSLPIGLLLFWLLLLLAGGGHLAAAILLPLYYLADATVTLSTRVFNGEHLTQAHRRHFYQRALDRGGMPVMRINAHIAGTNAVLVVLAVATIVYPVLWFEVLATLAGCGLVALLLYRFARSA